MTAAAGCRKVLIVSPNWPPVTGPDMHRVRMALPYLREFGWQPLVLACDSREHEGTLDPELAATIPPDVVVKRVGAMPRWLTKWFGVRNESLRSFFNLAGEGARMIVRERPDVVLFSTTMFLGFVLGRLWHAAFGVPYVLDYQDPWLSDYKGAKVGLYATRKYALTQRMAAILEPITLRKAAAVVAVSPAYIEALVSRYPWLQGRPLCVLPFGGSEFDFDHARATLPGWKNPFFTSGDGLSHWVYAGRGGSDMGVALRALFGAFRELLDRDRSRFEKIRMHFIGTSYASEGRQEATVMPVAQECGVASFVDEITARQPYFETLRTLLSASGLLLPGSDDPAYNASKLYPYLLAGRPLLAIFHEKSPVSRVLAGLSAVRLCTFGGHDGVSLMDAVADAITGLVQGGPAVVGKRAIGLTAREMTKQLIAVLDVVRRSEGALPGA